MTAAHLQYIEVLSLSVRDVLEELIGSQLEREEYHHSGELPPDNWGLLEED